MALPGARGGLGDLGGGGRGWGGGGAQESSIPAIRSRHTQGREKKSPSTKMFWAGTDVELIDYTEYIYIYIYREREREREIERERPMEYRSDGF